MLDLNAGIPLVDEPELLEAMAAGLTSAIMSTAEVCVHSVRACDVLLGRVGSVVSRSDLRSSVGR